MPASPLRVERRREPCAIPGGILILILLVCSVRPSPLHASHGFSITSPRPRQRGQVCETWKNPRELTTWPRPRQVLQVTAREPAEAPLPEHLVQVSSLRTSISFSTPKAASS